MDRSQFLLVTIPALLFFADVVNLFTAPPPPPPKPAHRGTHQFQPTPHQSQPLLPFPTQKSDGIAIGGLLGSGSTVNIDFCASCSYRGTAMNMKNMLEQQFPGVVVVLANYPPSLPKRILSKVVPVVQFGVVGMMLAGDQIFPRLGFAAPPQWYHSLRANRFGSIASTWMLGNFVQNFLQSSGAFEVYCNGHLVFSKLMENRFPGEIELRELVRNKLGNARVVQGY